MTSAERDLVEDSWPRLVAIRRGGILIDADHHLVALRAAACAEPETDRISRPLGAPLSWRRHQRHRGGTMKAVTMITTGHH